MVKVSIASVDDLQDIVKIHIAAFPDFFLTKLGTNFLYLYYKSVLNNQDGILLVSMIDGRCIGLCAGTVMSAGFNTRLIKSNITQYCIESLKLLFTNPKSLLHLMRNLTKENSSVGDDGHYAELLSIAVDPRAQRVGAGKAMLQEMEIVVKKKGGERLSLTTDYKDNDKAINFYKTLGYESWYDFITYPNRRMYRLIKNL